MTAAHPKATATHRVRAERVAPVAGQGAPPFVPGAALDGLGAGEVRQAPVGQREDHLRPLVTAVRAEEVQVGPAERDPQG